MFWMEMSYQKFPRRFNSKTRRQNLKNKNKSDSQLDRQLKKYYDKV